MLVALALLLAGCPAPTPAPDPFDACDPQPEVCNGLDDDCDGVVDDEPADAEPWFVDTDGDGFGQTEIVTCREPSNGTKDGGDCDDEDADVFPGAEELCTDLVDLDCDGHVTGEDADGDGFVACEECDDGNAAVFPGAAETCDGVDQDCDGEIDEDATDVVTTWADADGDGFGDAATPTTGCVPPPGDVTDATDCDDRRPDVFPASPEVCDGIDQDCDGSVDEDALDEITWYRDADGDGVGDGAALVARCVAPGTYAATGGDCDDRRADVAPGLPERCDGVDQDCDGSVDEDATDGVPSFADADGDGFGAGTSSLACAVPFGRSTNGKDCDDTRAIVFPGASETCDGVDQDCDGAVDEAAIDAPSWHTDADGDGFGSPAAGGRACVAPPGTAATGTDCDDADPAVFPGAGCP